MNNYEYLSRDDTLFAHLANEAVREFESLSDYIFKSPRFLESEERLEREKLDAYFPEDSLDINILMARKYREKSEFDNILIRFPHYMYVSNFLISTSIFESYIYSLCREIALVNKSKSLVIPNGGMRKLFAFIGGIYGGVSKVDLYVAIDSAIEIRNCLTHSNGMIDKSNTGNRLTSIVRNKRYASNFHQDRWKKLNIDESHVFIQTIERCDYLRMNNTYPWLSNWYYRQFFLNLCAHIDPPRT